jgi:ankyrin repeat protein
MVLNTNKILKPKSKRDIFNGIKLNNINSETLLIKSVESGFLEGVKLAIKLGSARVIENDRSILNRAAFFGHYKIVKYLLQFNTIDIHYRLDAPLRHASEFGHIDVVKLLLQRGADAQAIDDYAIKAAITNNHTEVVELLKLYSGHVLFK